MCFFCKLLVGDIHIKDYAWKWIALALGSLWGLSPCGFYALRFSCSEGVLSRVPAKPNAPLRKGPSDRAWTSMWRFYSWRLGVLSVMETEKGKFEHVKTQDQRNQVTKHLREHLLRLALQERWINSWCLSPHHPPSPGAVSPLSTVSVYESLVTDIYLCLSLGVFL